MSHRRIDGCNQARNIIFAAQTFIVDHFPKNVSLVATAYRNKTHYCP